MSIYADCFVVAGLAMYACAGTAQEPYAFAKNCTAPSWTVCGAGISIPFPIRCPTGFVRTAFP